MHSQHAAVRPFAGFLRQCTLLSDRGRVLVEMHLCLVYRVVDELATGKHGSPHCGVALLGSAVNQDGRSSSLTAPHGPSQQACAQLLGNLVNRCCQ